MRVYPDPKYPSIREREQIAHIAALVTLQSPCDNYELDHHPNILQRLPRYTHNRDINKFDIVCNRL